MLKKLKDGTLLLLEKEVRLAFTPDLNPIKFEDSFYGPDFDTDFRRTTDVESLEPTKESEIFCMLKRPNNVSFYKVLLHKPLVIQNSNGERELMDGVYSDWVYFISKETPRTPKFHTSVETIANYLISIGEFEKAAYLEFASRGEEYVNTYRYTIVDFLKTTVAEFITRKMKLSPVERHEFEKLKPDNLESYKFGDLKKYKDFLDETNALLRVDTECLFLTTKHIRTYQPSEGTCRTDDYLLVRFFNVDEEYINPKRFVKLKSFLSTALPQHAQTISKFTKDQDAFYFALNVKV